MTGLTLTQKEIIKILFAKKESSRSKLSSLLSLTPAGLTLALKPLLSSGMINESKNVDESRSGRKELTLCLNPTYGAFIGIDVRKHRSYLCKMDFAGNPLSSSDTSKTSIKDFILSSKEKILFIGVTMRGKSSSFVSSAAYKEIVSILDSLSIPYTIINNVAALSAIYYLFHKESENFLLVKYGPGVGSSIYVNGHPLSEESELGHTIYEGQTLEEAISYSSLFNKDIDEKEGTKLILENESYLATVMKALRFAIYNADVLISFQKIVLSGSFLTAPEMLPFLKKAIKDIGNDFDDDKICLYEDYESLNEIKGAIAGFIEYFR